MVNKYWKQAIFNGTFFFQLFQLKILRVSMNYVFLMKALRLQREAGLLKRTE